MYDQSFTERKKLNLSENKTNVRELFIYKKYINFQFQQPSMFLFLVYHKSGLIRNFPSFEDLSGFKM
jgi:hypothetical protein